MALNPAISRRGYRLAIELFSSARSIDQLDLDPPGQKPRTLVTAVSGENAGQQLSPDGKGSCSSQIVPAVWTSG